MEGNKLNPALIIALLAVLGIGGYFVYANTKNNGMAPQGTAQVTGAPTQAPAGTDNAGTSEENVKMIEVEAGGFYFKPNELRVKKGEKVKLTLKSVELMHDFVVDELGIKVPVTTDGNSSTVEFTADKAGSFQYYCSVGNHRKNGQVGTLVVEE